MRRFFSRRACRRSSSVKPGVGFRPRFFFSFPSLPSTKPAGSERAAPAGAGFSNALREKPGCETWGGVEVEERDAVVTVEADEGVANAIEAECSICRPWFGSDCRADIGMLSVGTVEVGAYSADREC